MTLNGKNDFWHKIDPTDIRRRLDKKYPGARQSIATVVATVFPKAAPYVAVGLAIDAYTDNRRLKRLEKEERQAMQAILDEDIRKMKETELQNKTQEKTALNWILPLGILLISAAG